MVLVSYKLLKEHRTIRTIVCVFELAVVRRLLHAGLGDILPLRGEPHDHGGVYHGIVLRGRRAAARYPQTPRGPPLAQRGRHLGAVTRAQRRRQPPLLSVADARLSAVVSAAPRAYPALASPQDPSGLDAGFLGRPNRARGHRHVWDRVDSSHARRPEPPTDWPQRPLESSLDGRRQTLSPAQSVGINRGV